MRHPDMNCLMKMYFKVGHFSGGTAGTLFTIAQSLETAPAGV